MRARFDSRLVVSQETSVRISSKPTSWGAIAVGAAGAFTQQWYVVPRKKDRNHPAGVNCLGKAGAKSGACPGQDCLRRFDDAQLNFDDRSFPDPGLAAGA